MSRYNAPDGEFEPNSRDLVLLNNKGVTDPVEAGQIETELLVVAYVDSLEWVTMSMQFTAALICEMHRLWLGEFYPSAGQYRRVNLSKDGFLFCPAENIPSEMRRFENEHLSTYTPCRSIVSGVNPDGSRSQDTSRPSVAEVAFKASTVHAELLLIHPFREGNGRLGRWLADLMILQSGYPAPEYDLDADAKRRAYYSAMRKAFANDLRPLTALFVTWIERAEQLSAERPPPGR